MRLIDADVLTEKMMWWFGENMLKDEKKARTISLAIGTINDCESVDAIPVEWLLNWSETTDYGKQMNDTGYQVIRMVIADWRKKHETD